MNDKIKINTIRQECWNNALHNFGTAYIFEKRAYYVRMKLQILTFLGIAVPIAVGSIILSFGSDFIYLNIVIIIAGILSTLQLIVSIWSLVAKWNDSLAFSKASTSSNYELSNKFHLLGNNPPSKFSEIKLKFEILNVENQNRSQQDYQQGITDREKRMGLRAALRNFQRECVGCGKIPNSMKSTKCDVCGNF